MSQTTAWEGEYQKPRLLTKEAEPQKDVLRYLRFLKKQGVDFSRLSVLDLGCGTGRNANYLAGLGAEVIGFDISKTALQLAKERAEELLLSVDYRLQSIGTAYPLQNGSISLALDVISSNSLSSAERSHYLAEVERVLEPGGHFFVKALCKEGDHNAKALLKLHPGPEPDTYVMPGIGFVERIFDRDAFVTLYAPRFRILKLIKKTNYAEFQGQHYKRNYWIAYMQKSQ